MSSDKRREAYFPRSTSGKEPQANQSRRCYWPGFHPWAGKIPWRRAWQPPPLLLPGESRGQWSLVGYSPQGRKDSGRLKRLNTHAGRSVPNSVHAVLVIVSQDSEGYMVIEGFLQSWGGGPYSGWVILNTASSPGSHDRKKATTVSEKLLCAFM